MLEYLVLLGASGKHVHIKGFNDREINHCARKLIDKGFLRGTYIDADHCSWNRTTQKGISTNHVHLLLQIDTKRPICKTVEIIKSISSKKFKKLSGSDWHGWQNGYFISSVGRSTKSKIQKYLEEQ